MKGFGPAWAAVGAATLLLAPWARAATFPWNRARLWSYTARYAVSGRVSGTVTWTVAVKGASTDFTAMTSIAGETEIDRFVLASAGLGFVSGTERLTAPGASVVIQARANRGVIDETAVVNGRHEQVTLKDGAATFANEALLATLSGAPWRPGARTVIVDALLQHGGEARLGLAAGRAVRLRTPAGSFTCLPVTLSSAGGVQTAWISEGSRPVLVKYANGTTTFTLAALRP